MCHVDYFAVAFRCSKRSSHGDACAPCIRGLNAILLHTIQASTYQPDLPSSLWIPLQIQRDMWLFEYAMSTLRLVWYYSYCVTLKWHVHICNAAAGSRGWKVRCTTVYNVSQYGRSEVSRLVQTHHGNRLVQLMITWYSLHNCIRVSRCRQVS